MNATEIKVTLPTIHLNGTSPGELLEGYRNAMDKVCLSEALKAHHDMV